MHVPVYARIDPNAPGSCLVSSGVRWQFARRGLLVAPASPLEPFLGSLGCLPALGSVPTTHHFCKLLQTIAITRKVSVQRLRPFDFPLLPCRNFSFRDVTTFPSMSIAAISIA